MGIQPGAPRKWHLEKGDCSGSTTTPPPPPTVTSLPSSSSQSKDARANLKKTIRLFHTLRKSIQDQGDFRGCRIDREAARILMRDRPSANVGNKMVGPVSGILVGDKFRYRVELRLVGIHRPTESGIDYAHFHGTTVAISVVACELYGDDLSHRNRLTYTGQGGFEAEHIEGRGLALSNRKKPQDQQLVRGNLALAHNVKDQIPVRVIRAYKSSDLRSTYVYDGLYLVDRFWQERGPQGNLVFKFQLSRMEGEGNQPVRYSKTHGRDESRSSINMDGRSLQFLITEQLKRIDAMRTQMSAAFRVSSDPGKLVLDAMQGYYPSNLNLGNRETDFDLRFTRRSCILLLQELEWMSPLINPCVREEALKLATDWKAKMTVATDNSLEVLGFLWLLIAYELASAYDANELQGLLTLVAEPEQAAQLRRALGVKDKAPATNSISSLGKVVEPESMNAATFSSSNLQPNATMDARTYNLESFSSSNLQPNATMDARTYNLESEYPSADIQAQSGNLERAKENWRRSVPSLDPIGEQQEQRKRKKPSASTSAPEFQPPPQA